MITFLTVFLTGIFSGFVDAIAGGGGLIMIPGLIVVGLPITSVIATNKLCGTFGALTSSIKYSKEKHVDWKSFVYMGIPAIIGSFFGSRSLNFLPQEYAEPLVILLLVFITLFVLLKPDFGEAKNENLSLTEQYDNDKIAKLLILGIIIGFHDGFFGPGTGTFIIFALVSVLKFDFLRGTGTAKVINLMTNLTALLSFIFIGNIRFTEGITGALGVIIGAYLGSSFATKKGAKFIKPVFVTITVILIGKLIWEYL
ncbi:MAG: TSUP family transporter [Cyanobacteria bacterium P01_C01_bin.72]